MFASIGLKIAIGLGAIGIVLAGWFYVQSLQASLEAASERNARTMDIVNEQVATMNQLQADIKKVQEVTSKLNQEVSDAKKSVVALDNKFEKNNRDIGKDAAAKPEVVQKIINRASKDAIRCGELVTGAPPRPKETNSQCPELVKGEFVKKPDIQAIKESVK